MSKLKPTKVDLKILNQIPEGKYVSAASLCAEETSQRALSMIEGRLELLREAGYLIQVGTDKNGKVYEKTAVKGEGE